jgi:hypothetical protein
MVLSHRPTTPKDARSFLVVFVRLLEAAHALQRKRPFATCPTDDARRNLTRALINFEQAI